MTGYLPDEPVVLCRGRSLARSIVERSSRQALIDDRRAWVSPAVFPLDTYLRRAWARFGAFLDGRRLLSDSQARTLFQRAARQVASEVDADGVAEAADALYRSFRLANDWCIPGARLAASADSADQRILAAAAHQYRGELAANGWIDSVELPAALASIDWPARELPAGGFELAGFLNFTPTQERLFAAWRAAGCSVEARRAIAPQQQHRWALPADDRTELIAAGRWARALLEVRPATRVAIVVPGLAGDSERATALIADGLQPGWQLDSAQVDWHVSFGKPLGAYPLIAALVRPLVTLLEAVAVTSMSRLLLDGALWPAAAQPALALVERSLRERPERRWRVSELTTSVERTTPAGQVLDALAAVEAELREFGDVNTPQHWAGRLADAGDRLLALRERSIDSIEHQLLNAWRDSLNALANLDAVEPRMSGRRAVTAWQWLLGNTLFQTENTGARVDIVGPLEAIGHRYDALWFARLDEQHWPPVTQASPFIGRGLQSEFGMPGTDLLTDRQFATDLLTTVIAGADEVVTSAAQRIGDLPARPAGLALRRWPVDGPSSTPLALSRFSRREHPDVVACVDDDVPLAVEEVPSGGSALLATAAASQTAAFIQHRLGADPLPTMTSGLGARQRGIALHRAAELWHRSELDGLERPPATDIARAALASYRGHRDAVLHRLLDAEERRIVEILGGLKRFDEARPAHAIAALEQTFEYRLGGLSLRLRIDRLDRVAGRAVLIDYKSGANLKSVLHKASGLPHELQLAIYGLALRQHQADVDIAALAVLRLHTRGIVASGFAFGDAVLPVKPTASQPTALLDAWDQQMQAIGAAFERGELAFDPSEVADPDWFLLRPLVGAYCQPAQSP
ncbi:MAG: PD-(D/E)XK nuclease family protein [Pseudomonadota bacterium]